MDEPRLSTYVVTLVAGSRTGIIPVRLRYCNGSVFLLISYGIDFYAPSRRSDFGVSLSLSLPDLHSTVWFVLFSSHRFPASQYHGGALLFGRGDSIKMLLLAMRACMVRCCKIYGVVRSSMWKRPECGGSLRGRHSESN